MGNGTASISSQKRENNASQHLCIADWAFRHPLLGTLKQHFLGHLAEPLTTARAAELLGFSSRTYFCEFFRKQTGRAFVAWRRECRLEQAKRLLAEYPWITITDVAVASGLDASSFARIFRSHVGVTPRNFRKQANESRATHHQDASAQRKRKTAEVLAPRSDLRGSSNRTLVREKGAIGGKEYQSVSR